MAFDTFVGLPLDQSIAGATWDSGGLVWGTHTYLAGDGNGEVKPKDLPAGKSVLANVVLASSVVAISVRFKPGAGKATAGRYLTLAMHGTGSTSSADGLTGVAVRLGEYNTLKCFNLADSAATEITTGALTIGAEYEAEIRWLSGSDYVAKLYAVTNGVRGANPLFTTPTLTIATARPATARVSQLYGGSGVESTYSRFETFESAPASTVPVTLSGGSLVATSSTTATGTVNADWPVGQGGGTLRAILSANQSESAATIKATGSSQIATATGAQTVEFTGQAAGTTRYAHFVMTNGAGDSNVISAGPVTFPAPDTVAPTWPNAAAITPGAVTQSSVSGSYPAATDNVAVVGYQYSTNSGASWVENGTGLTFNIGGIPAGTTVPVWIRAKDAAGNFSTPLQISMATSAATTGSFKSSPLSNGALSAWPSGTAVVWEWHQGGRIGSAPVSTTRGTGALASDRTLTVTGCPLGAGVLLIGKRGATVAADDVYLEVGTVT